MNDFVTWTVSKFRLDEDPPPLIIGVSEFEMLTCWEFVRGDDGPLPLL